MLPLAIASLGLSAAQSISGFFGQRNEARAQNEAAAKQYKQQLKIYKQEDDYARQLYGFQKSQYKQQIRSIDEAAALGFSRAQTQKNEALKAASFQTQDRLIQLARSQGATSATGAAGKSAQRLDADVLKSFGRGQAKLSESLLSGDIAMQQSLQDLKLQAEGARNQAYGQVAIAPRTRIAPLAPTQASGPSPVNLALDLGGDLVNAMVLDNKLHANR
ncbi:MAG: hypothetical protein CL855_04700 [Cryomorphaceae bacterium]|nr:hypothetical protein [Cryomorphaceae bacterium]